MSRSSPHSCIGILAAAPPTDHDEESFCDTPKAHNKRRSIACVSSSGSSSSASSISSSSRNTDSSSFNCESLQRSLKRVRLSATISAGELRLQRDLRHAVFHQQWIPVQEDEWRVAYNNNNNNNDATESAAAAAPATTAVVTVSRIAPMELALYIPTDCLQLQLQHYCSKATTMTSSTITLHLQFPLLYPHRPPTVRVVLPRNNHSNFNTSTSGPWKILIAASPDEATAYKNSMSSCACTILWEEWTPILRLSDICSWLVETCLRHAAIQLTSTTNINSVISSDISHPGPLLHLTNHHHHLFHSSKTILSDCRTTHCPQQEEKKDDDVVGPPNLPREEEEDDDDDGLSYLDKDDYGGSHVVPSPVWNAHYSQQQQQHRYPPSWTTLTTTPVVAPVAVESIVRCRINEDKDGDL